MERFPVGKGSALSRLFLGTVGMEAMPVRCGDLQRSVGNEVGMGGIWEVLVEAGVRPLPPEQRGVGIAGIVPKRGGWGPWGHGQWGCGGLRGLFQEEPCWIPAVLDPSVCSHVLWESRKEGWELLPAKGRPFPGHVLPSLGILEESWNHLEGAGPLPFIPGYSKPSLEHSRDGENGWEQHQDKNPFPWELSRSLPVIPGTLPALRKARVPLHPFPSLPTAADGWRDPGSNSRESPAHNRATSAMAALQENRPCLEFYLAGKIPAAPPAALPFPRIGDAGFIPLSGWEFPGNFPFVQ